MIFLRVDSRLRGNDGIENIDIMTAVTTHKSLILASGSVGRRQLLECSQLTFDIVPADVDESALKAEMADAAPQDIALALAEAKAKKVSMLHPEAYVIGGDQICAFSSMILDKPGDENTAMQHLTMLAGNTHQQISAVCVYLGGECVWSLVDVAELTMRKLSESEIRSYVTLDQPLGSCGAYKFESLGCHLFSDVSGAADTIVGMPLLQLLAALRELKVYSL